MTTASPRKAIELLKNRRAGRLTFLPLNKIRAPGGGGGAAMARGRRPEASGGGWPDRRAVDLMRFEPIYGEVFAYVFGDTQVFTDLQTARRVLGRARAVTLEGELLEKRRHDRRQPESAQRRTQLRHQQR